MMRTKMMDLAVNLIVQTLCQDGIALEVLLQPLMIVTRLVEMG